MPPGSGADLPPPREDREVDGTSGVSKNPRAERRADDEPRPNRQSARACAMRAAGVVAGRREGPASVRESTKGRAAGGYQRLQEADTPGGMDEGAAAAMMV